MLHTIVQVPRVQLVEAIRILQCHVQRASVVESVESRGIILKRVLQNLLVSSQKLSLVIIVDLQRTSRANVT